MVREKKERKYYTKCKRCNILKRRIDFRIIKNNRSKVCKECDSLLEENEMFNADIEMKWYKLDSIKQSPCQIDIIKFRQL